MKAIVFTDGGSRDQGRQASVGVSLCNDREEEVLAYSQRLHPGIYTCNEAEYHALLAALQISASLGVDDLAVRSDSQLVVNQVSGRYGCRKDRLSPLLGEVQALRRSFTRFSITHIRRALNQRADQLAGIALNRGPGDPVWHWSCIAL
jgi:ribonuclease HI